MTSFADDNVYKKCNSNLSENLSKKMVVFRKTDTKIELSNSINRISLPKGILYPNDRLPGKIPNLING
jgi:hypothetical protein